MIMNAIAPLHHGDMSARVLRSVLTRFGFDDEQAGLARLRVLELRSVERYRGGAILPLAKWLHLGQALQSYRPGLAGQLVPGDALLRVGCLLHQGNDENDAWDRGTPRSRRYILSADPARVHAAGERLAVGDVDHGSLLLAARYIASQVTGDGRLRPAGQRVLERLSWLLAKSDPPGHHRNVLVNEALRNIPDGPAANVLVDMLSSRELIGTCVCSAARQLLLTDSDLSRSSIGHLLSDPANWAAHPHVMSAACKLRIAAAVLPDLSELPSLPQKVAEGYHRYLMATPPPPTASAQRKARRLRLLGDLRDHIGRIPPQEAEDIQATTLIDRTGRRLAGDPAVPRLWCAALLGHNADERSVAAQILKDIGVTPEERLRQLAADHSLCQRLRVNAISALGVFEARPETERILRALADNDRQAPAIRMQALWAYDPEGTQTGWMFRLLADPGPGVRQALMYAASRNGMTGIILAGLADTNPEVAAAASCHFAAMRRQGLLPADLDRCATQAPGAAA
jgi:hypothetical protein